MSGTGHLQEIQDMLKRDKASADYARIRLALALIDNDSATDLSAKQIVALTVLEAIQSRIKTKFLGVVIDRFKHNRKSLNRKDRKEFVEMFKSIADEEKKLTDKMKGLIGFE